MSGGGPPLRISSVALSNCRVRQDPHDPRGSERGILVFPHPNDFPPGALEPPIRVAVPLDVPCDLGGPVPAVDVVQTLAVVGASVPEAAVHEDGHPSPGEHEVGPPIEVGQRPDIDSVPGPAAVQQPTEAKLWAGTDAPHCLHPSSNRFGCRKRLARVQ